MEIIEKRNKVADEWMPQKKWNPFNSYKLLSQVYRWQLIKQDNPIPQPALISVDPSNLCDLNCVWCNAKFVREHRKTMLSEKIMNDIADFLPRWHGNPNWQPGVEAVCIAGGGEPLLNPYVGEFIERLVFNGIDVGVVTNGTMIDKFIEPLSKCTWVGVSVDAGSSKTFNKLKGLSNNSDAFNKIINNMAKLIDYSKTHNTKLGKNNPSYGVSYKYLLYNKENISEVYQSAKIAKEIGCKHIHIRPCGDTWDRLDMIKFDESDIELYKKQITETMELDDEKFNVYGVTHKFNSQFYKANYFNKCWAIFMTLVIMPPTDKSVPKDSFTISLCCDRRGDERIELARNITNVEEIIILWGRKKHWQIHENINVKKECPRCTYQPHNQIYEQVILADSMTYRFI